MSLIAVMNVYNEARTIRKSIESFIDHVDSVHVFDGAYEQFPHEFPFSTDGTEEICRSFGEKVVFHNVDKPWKDQCEKRTEMYKVGGKGDFYLKIDGDEVIVNPEELRKNLEHDVLWVWVNSNLYAQPYMVARIYRHIEGMHHAGRHHWLFDGKNNFITSDQNMGARFDHRDTKIRMYNLRNERSSQRGNQKRSFIKNRNRKELSFKREDQVYGKFATMIPHHRRATDPRPPSLILRESLQIPKYTMSFMISRSWVVGKFFRNLATVKIPKNTEAVVVVDSRSEKLLQNVVSYFEKDKRFTGVCIYFTQNEPLPEFARVRERRQRIVDNWQIILTEACGEILLGAEDDSLTDRNAYIDLLRIREENSVDFVQGNIVGRWGKKLCPAWLVEEVEGEPVRVSNAKERSSGLLPIQGMGWYCFVCPMDVMRSVPMLVDSTLPLGPDLRFGYMLHRAGRKLLHSWDVKVKHVTREDELYPGITKTEECSWIKKEGVWAFAE